MGAARKRKGDRSGQRFQGVAGSGRQAHPTGRETRVDSAIARLMAYGGYVGAVVLIVQPLTGNAEEPKWGFSWSPALLGVLLAVVTAIFRDELGVRSRLGLLDDDTSGRRAVTLVWAILGLVGIFGILTYPRY